MRTITARPFWKKPASSMSASASACSSWSTACRRKPTPRPGRRVRRFRSAPWSCSRSAWRRWSARSCSSGSMSAATSCGGSAICSRHAGAVRAATSKRSLSDPPPGRDRRMADSLQVFRESMIQSRALSAEQDKDRVAKAERASHMEQRSSSSRTPCAPRSTRCRRPRNAMQSTAQNMSATADKSSALATAVATAAEETSVNVQTVSSGTEELSSSIEEISRQVSNSTTVAGKAVTRRARPTPPCRASPTARAASRRWST